MVSTERNHHHRCHHSRPFFWGLSRAVCALLCWFQCRGEGQGVNPRSPVNSIFCPSLPPKPCIYRRKLEDTLPQSIFHAPEYTREYRVLFALRVLECSSIAVSGLNTASTIDRSISSTEGPNTASTGSMRSSGGPNTANTGSMISTEPRVQAASEEQNI